MFSWLTSCVAAGVHATPKAPARSQCHGRDARQSNTQRTSAVMHVIKRYSMGHKLTRMNSVTCNGKSGEHSQRSLEASMLDELGNAGNDVAVGTGYLARLGCVRPVLGVTLPHDGQQQRAVEHVRVDNVLASASCVDTSPRVRWLAKQKAQFHATTGTYT